MMEKTCIITGASEGIGRAAAIAVAESEEYKNIILIARRLDQLHETKEKMSEAVNVECISFDLTQLDAIDPLIQQLYIKYGRIDALVNNAGYADPKSLLDTTMENIKLTYTLNVFAVFGMIKAVTRYMKNHGGKIINIGSTAGMSSRPGWLTYASSKASVIAMSSTLSNELSEYKIKTYCLSPGRCATSLRKKLAPDEDASTIMPPKAVGDIIANLLTSEERYLDGQNIVVRLMN